MMKQYKYFFMASAIAILFSAGANAATTEVSGLATTNYVDGALGNVVHKTGDETIDGTKTFKTQPVSDTTTTYANATDKALVTKGQVADGVIGKIPSGSETSKTYAQIWIE